MDNFIINANDVVSVVIPEPVATTIVMIEGPQGLPGTTGPAGVAGVAGSAGNPAAPALPVSPFDASRDHEEGEAVGLCVVAAVRQT